MQKGLNSETSLIPSDVSEEKKNKNYIEIDTSLSLNGNWEILNLLHDRYCMNIQSFTSWKLEI